MSRPVIPALRGQNTTASNLLLGLPAGGDAQLQVLSPTLLELKLVQVKPPDPAPLAAWNFASITSPSLALSAPQFTAFVDSQSIAVSAVGFKRRPVYAPLKSRDLRVASYLYLQLASPVPDGKAVAARNPDSTLLSADLPFNATAAPLRTSPVIHVNQLGYVPGYPKKAMVGYYLGTLGEMDISANAGFKLVDASDAEVFSGSLVARPDQGWNYSPAPYQKVYEADFTSFDKPGTYRLVVPGLGASLPFRIDDGVFMNFARAYALGLYHQRCGTTNALPFTRFVHDACHTAPASVPLPASNYAFTWKTVANYANETNSNNPAQTAPRLTSDSAQLYPFVNQGPIDVSGGHHDAGDYSKYTTNSAALVHVLMFAVDSLPGVADLDNLGVPESGDGVPDILQEAKWEADYLAKLQDADGGFYFLVYPTNREYEGNVLPDHGDAQVVWPKNTAASAAATAALAQCASSPAMKKYFPDAAAAYLAKARAGWQFLTDAIAKYGKAGAYQKLTHYGDNFTHDDELAWAATEMFLATGDPAIHETLRAWFDPANPATWRWGWWHMNEAYGNAARSYAFAARSGRVTADKLDAAFLAKCEAQLAAGGDDTLKWSQQSAYGTSLPLETKRARSGGWYFSLDQAFDLAAVMPLGFPPQSGLREKYLAAYVANLNYEAGTNPVNVSYVTGLGQQRSRELVSQYAQNDRRVLPPSGLPLGNIQAGQPYLDLYKAELGTLAFPGDGSDSAPYPYYDRWTDTYNVSTEFVVVNQARALAGVAFMAAQTSLKTQPWRPTAATINLSSGTAQLSVPSGLDPAQASIVWEAGGRDPASGPTFTVPAGVSWVEAEALWPDGRRVFAASDAPATSSNGPPVVTMTAQGGASVIDASHAGVLVFQRSGDVTAPLTVRFNLSGSAVKWNDYRTPQGDMPQSVTFPAGADHVTLTIIPAPNNPSALLGTKSFTLSLASGSGYSNGSASSATFVLGQAQTTTPPVTTPPITTPPVTTPPTITPPTVVTPPTTTPPITTPPVTTPPTTTPPTVVTPPTTTPPVTTPPVTTPPVTTSPTTTPPVTVTPPAAASQITNFSARADVGRGGRPLIVGFVIEGTNKPMLIRGIGPSLRAFGLAGMLAQPELKIYNGGTLISNSNTPRDDGPATAMSERLGAFRLAAGAGDPALLTTVDHGAYTALLTGANDASGIGLVEIYDADPGATPSLRNVSVLTSVEDGEHGTFAGFVISGRKDKQLLIRGVGPALTQFGVAGVLAAPNLRLFSGDDVVASNTNWNFATNASAITDAAAQVGAFPLRTADPDAALLLSLRPGAYTVQILDANNSPGVALVEIYDVQ